MVAHRHDVVREDKMLQTNILFVDSKNNGRSILAEAYFNLKNQNEMRAFSAGIRPEQELDKHVYELMRDKGIDPEDYCPKPIDIFCQPYSPRIDLIVGFKPEIDVVKLPLFTNRPAFIQLMVEPVHHRIEELGRRRAYRTCYHDIALAIDRALVSGQLPKPRAA